MTPFDAIYPIGGIGMSLNTVTTILKENFWIALVAKRGENARTSDVSDAVLVAASNCAIANEHAHHSLKRDFMDTLMAKAMDAVGVNCQSLTDLNFAGCRYLSDDTLKAIAANCRSVTALDVSATTLLFPSGTSQ